MKAVIISYKTRGLSKTDSSKISKKLVGYTDKSNRSNYHYERKGLIEEVKGLIISKSTFIVSDKRANEIKRYITSKKGVISTWDIEIPRRYFKS